MGPLPSIVFKMFYPIRSRSTRWWYAPTASFGLPARWGSSKL